MANEVAQLVDEYKNLANKTVDNCKNFANNLPQKVEEVKTQCQNLQPTVTEYINSFTNDIQNFAQDMAPPGEDAGLFKNLLENYLWASVCLLATSIVSTLLSKVVGVILGLFLAGSAAAFVALVAIPYAMINYIPTMEGSEEDRRMALLAASALDGLVLGLVLAGTYLTFYAPPTWLLPLGMGVLSSAVGPNVGGQPRHVFLGVTVGAPLALYCVYGMMMGGLGGMYFLWMLALGGAAAVDMQVKIGKFKGGQTSSALHQGVSVTVLLLTSFAMRFISSTGTDETMAENVN